MYRNPSDNTFYVLQLYITGATHHSMLAVKNVKQFCEQYLAHHYELQIIDVYQQPLLAEEKDLIATPTLIKLKPEPVRRCIGDLSNLELVFSSLDIRLEEV